MYKISIVTVTYNCKNVVEKTIRSIISQDYDKIEYVVVDGASTDGTIEIIKRYSSKISCWISEPDKGIFDAMNKSLEYVKGDYVLFLNAGDYFVNEHIVSNVFANYIGEADLIYGDVYVENELGLLLRKADAIYSHPFTVRDLVFRSQGFSHQSLFTKTSILKEIKFDLRFPLGADYHTTYLIYKSGNHQLHYVGFPISVFDDKTPGASHGRQHIPAILEERLVMFDYKMTIVDKLVLWVSRSLQSFRWYLMRTFPTLATKYRNKNRNYIRLER